MKKILIISFFTLICCNRNSKSYPPIGGVLNKNDLEISKNRMKGLNAMERDQIQDWISKQNTSFYPTRLNYWSNVPQLDQRSKRENETTISYSYNLYDFDQTKIYEKPHQRQNVRFGHFDELKAVEDALRYMKEGEEVTLLVPSALAYGTYGDENKIDNDIPLIIKIKVL